MRHGRSGLPGRRDAVSGSGPADLDAAGAGPAQRAAPIALDDRLRELESSLIGWALKVSRGNKSKAAELLQIKRSTLGDRINRCRLQQPAVDSAQV